MTLHLVVVRPFDGIARGDVVADAAHVATILAGAHAHCVVRVMTGAAAAKPRTIKRTGS